MMRTVLHSRQLVVAAAAAVATAALFAGCGRDELPSKPPPGAERAVSEEQTRRVLAAAVESVRTRGIKGACDASLFAPICHQAAADGADAVPPEDPEVLRYISLPGGKTGPGGGALVVRGVDGRGTPYCTQFYVFRSHDGVRERIPLWWSPRAGPDNPDGVEDPPDAAC